MVNISNVENEAVQILYDSALITAGAVAVGFATKKITGEDLSTPASLKETAKLAVAVALGSFLVGKLRMTGYLPRKIMKD